MTDFTVHRLRFGNWMPAAVKSIAVDRKFSNKVAVGREDGDIEVGFPSTSVQLYIWYFDDSMWGCQVWHQSLSP